MSLPRPPIKKNSFIVQVLVTLGLTLLVDYFGGGILFGHATFWDVAKTLGYALGLFLGLCIMKSYEDAAVGCILVMALLVATMLPGISAMRASGDRSWVGHLGVMSRPLWSFALAAIASGALEVRWKEHSPHVGGAVLPESNKQKQ